mmetsp:Transcript_2704/g.2325  ORF Transcript_2704/g.2325 Transcript_2704/m.2325 type:complete len:414 (+) Transcript_2704:213-1454(+)
MADDEGVYGLARAFFLAATKMSDDSEDILPQEDSEEMTISVFGVFSGLFQEAVGENGAGAKNKRMRLHFNKIGYSMYGKEQSRRVPSLRAKPGNPGYGFRRARWRDTLNNAEDRHICETVLKDEGCEEERIKNILTRIQEVRQEWDRVRRPSRPAGPGRPRRAGEGRVKMEEESETGGSRSPRQSDDSNDSDEARSSTLSPDNKTKTSSTTPPTAPRGLQKSGSEPNGLNFKGGMPLPAIDFSENRPFNSRGGKKMLPPSPALKRWRDNDDIFSPSIYPRLTALKLTSACNTPKPSQGRLEVLRKYECSPLLNRSSSKGTAHAPHDASWLDPCLLLPPLSLPQPAVPCFQPLGFEEQSIAQPRGSMLRGHTADEKTALPLPTQDYIELPRGCQALSALEFLANVASYHQVTTS